MKITIIGGGNIGGAIACGVAAGKQVKASDVTVADVSETALDRIRELNPQIGRCRNNAEAVADADLVIFAVKPWLAADVAGTFSNCLDLTRQAVVSIVAGLTFEQLKQLFRDPSGKHPVLFRLIPNTAISLRESVTFIASEGASETQLQNVVDVFNELGKTVVVPEAMMMAGTSLASCGIAFALKYLDASIQGGIELGFTEQESRDIVLQTMQGALALLQHNHTMPQTEIDKVTTPGGLTLKGLEAMADGKFSEAVRAGLLKSR